MTTHNNSHTNTVCIISRLLTDLKISEITFTALPTQYAAVEM